MAHCRTVWLIDDDNISNFISEQMVKQDNFCEQAMKFDSVKKTIESLDKIKGADDAVFPDYIFLDINMPELDGWDFLSYYKAFPEWFKRKCKLFMLSSSLDIADIEKAAQHPEITNYISKPLTFEDLAFIKSETEQFPANFLMQG
jgi:CheY-like chemotaxis protein